MPPEYEIDVTISVDAEVDPRTILTVSAEDGRRFLAQIRETFLAQPKPLSNTSATPKNRFERDGIL